MSIFKINNNALVLAHITSYAWFEDPEKKCWAFGASLVGGQVYRFECEYEHEAKEYFDRLDKLMEMTA